ncbi:MAG: sulfatase-like hydrolase/transferase [Oscillospiraceae bacterium]|jgi:phosphoglycerol transferase MdoB-like AlkP superfamily enzyme|nr:sulfatase-like hydrolase/transferase [Oscillospiraceae bacterium]
MKLKPIATVKKIRADNLTRYKRPKALMLALFPLFLTLATEAAHMNSFVELLKFMAAKPSVIFFDVLVITLIYAAIMLISRSAAFSAALCSFAFYAFSFVEFFKYETNGMHFNIADVMMTANVVDIAKFTGFRMTAGLVLTFLGLFAYTSALFLLNVKLPVKKRFGAISGVCVLAGFVSFFAVKPVYDRVYAFFKVNADESYNMFVSDEKFHDNMLIADIAVSVSKQFERLLGPPEEYSMETVDAILRDTAGQTTKDGRRPDVVVVMCESFCDLRQIGGIDVPDGVYDAFDRVAENSFSGRAIVPTLGNGTVQTEFELLFGLPVKSLNNHFTPHKLLKLDGETEETFARHYGDSGYSSYYLHPYKRDFYSRDKFYSEYGFDRLLFAEDFDVEPSYFFEYYDDATVFNQILSLLDGSDSPSYIHATTIQNHKPYSNDDFDGTEPDYYYAGLKKTCEALSDFYDAVSRRSDPVIVLFIGDHFPYFGVESDLYRQAGVNAENCAVLYEQTYLVFANYDADFTLMPENAVSSFYLPHLLSVAANGVGDDFIAAMLAKIGETPVYTDAGKRADNDDELDILTYDRTVGDKYS